MWIHNPVLGYSEWHPVPKEYIVTATVEGRFVQSARTTDPDDMAEFFRLVHKGCKVTSKVVV